MQAWLDPSPLAMPYLLSLHYPTQLLKAWKPALTNNTTNISASIPLKDKSMGRGGLNIKEAASQSHGYHSQFPQVSLVGPSPTITHPALGSADLAAATHKGAIFPQEWGNSLQLHPKA